MAIISVGQYSIVDANDGLSAQLTSNSVVLPSDKDGNVNSYAGAETRFTIFEAGVDMSVRWGFYVSAIGGGITFRDVNDTADRSDVGPTNGVLDSNYLRVTGLTQATSYIDITATRAGQQAIVRRYSVTRANTGATGTRGTMTVSRAISGASWSDSEAATAISGSGGGSPLRGDTVTLYRTSPALSETRVFNGTSWVTQAAYLAGSQIIDGSVNGNKITAGTIIGDRIAANTINTTKLAIADFTNYATNGDLTLGQVGWAGVTVSSDATNAYMGNTVITLPAGSTVNKYASNENIFSVKPGDSFYLEWWGKATSDMDSNFNVYVRVNNSSGGQIQSSGVGTIDKSSTSYTMRSGTITMPANAYQAYIQINWNNTVGTGYIGAVRMRRRNEGTLIVDGTITGNKVAANTLTGDNIAANTINAKSLLIGDTTNYAENADFGLGNVGWIIQQNSGAAATIVQASGDSYQSGWITNVAASSDGGIRNKANMRVKAGDQLMAYVIAKGGGSINCYPRISFLRADQSELSVVGGPSIVGNGSYQTVTVNGIVPTGAVFARVECFWLTPTGSFLYIGAAGLMRRMTGDLIVDGAITADKVDARAIQGKHIAGETITGDKLLAGTIKAAQIGAGEIVASKLAVGNTDSVVTDASFQDLNWWNGTTDGAGYAGTEVFETTSPWNLFRRAFRIKSGVFNFRTPMFPVEPGATYKVRVQTYVGDIDSNNSWFNPTIHMPNVAWLSLKDGKPYDNNDPSVKGSNSWTQRNYFNGFVPSSEFIITNPAAQNAAQWQFRFDGNLANDNVEIAISVVRVSDATLIADGAITTNKITVNTLNGDRIQADTLDANKVKANTVLSNLVTVKDTTGNIGDAVLRATDPAARINEHTTNIGPGKITIQGSTTLDNWRDQTFIKGGALKTNSVTADKITINSRGISSEGIDFEIKTVGGGNELTWNGGGYVRYLGDDGNAQSRLISGGDTYGVVKPTTVYWIVGENVFRATENVGGVIANPNAVIVATYMGGTAFNVNYGGTVINGDRITTGTIDANKIKANSILASTITVSGVTGSNSLSDAFSRATWSSVSGTGKPADNATVGAAWGTNLSGRPANVAALTGTEGINNANQSWADVSGAGKPETYTVCARGNQTATNTLPSNYAHGLRGSANNVFVDSYNTGLRSDSYARSYTLMWRVNSTYWAVRNYDVYGNGQVQYANPDNQHGSAGMAWQLNNLAAGTPVVIYTSDEPAANRLNNGLADAMYSCGASRVEFGAPTFASWGAYILIGQKGAGEGNGMEMRCGSGFFLMGAFSIVNGVPMVGGKTIKDAQDIAFPDGRSVNALNTVEAGATKGAPNDTYVGNQKAQDVAASIAAITNDDVISPSEKTTLYVQQQNVLQSENKAYLRATEYINANKGARYECQARRDAMVAAKETVLQRLSGVFNDMSSPSNVSGAAVREAFNTFADRYALMQDSLQKLAAESADFDLVTGTNKPENGATKGAPIGTDIAGTPAATVAKSALNSSNLSFYESVGGAGYSVFGNVVQRTADKGGFYGNVYSQEFGAGSARVSGRLLDKDTFLGLDIDRDGVGANAYTTIQFAWHWSGGSNAWQIYENNSQVWSGSGANGFTFNDGTLFSIEYDGKSIKYYANNAVVRTIAASPNALLAVAICIGPVGGRVGNVNLQVINDNSLANTDPAARINNYTTEISGNKIVTGSIEANKIRVDNLSAIKADLGTITAGTIKNANGSTNFDVTNGRITFDNGSVMRVMGNGFGSSNQFIEWFGPRQNSLSNCTEANATQYLKTNGSAYFGGTLSAGITKNAVNTTSIANTASVTTGQVGSRGGTRVVVVGYSWNQFVSVNKPQQPSSGGGLSAKIVLHRNGVEVASLDATGTWERSFASSDNEPGSYSEAIGGSITFTDNSGGDKVTYTAYLVSRTLGPGAQNGTNREPQYTQRIDIVQTEQ